MTGRVLVWGERNREREKRDLSAHNVTTSSVCTPHSEISGESCRRSNVDDKERESVRQDEDWKVL